MPPYVPLELVGCTTCDHVLREDLGFSSIKTTSASSGKHSCLTSLASSKPFLLVGNSSHGASSFQNSGCGSRGGASTSLMGRGGRGGGRGGGRDGGGRYGGRGRGRGRGGGGGVEGESSSLFGSHQSFNFGMYSVLSQCLFLQFP